MKKIAFFINHLDSFGGIERVTANITKELLKYAEVYIVSIIKDDTEEILDWYPSKAKFIKLDTQYSIHKYYFSNRKKICDVINEYGFDVVILQHVSAGFYGKDIKRYTGAKVIACDHGSAFAQTEKRLKKRIILCRVANGCDEFVVLTEKCKKEYIYKYHITSEKIHVIPNWINSKYDYKGEYNVNSRKIVSAGRLSEEKRFDLLIESFGIVHEKHPDWILDIYGDGEEKNNLVNLIKSKNLENNVILKGKSDNMMSIYPNYSFYVLTSKSEGLPMVLLEAKQNKLPIVSFDINAGPSDVITDGINGLLVKNGDKLELAKSICRMIDDPKLRGFMSQKTQTDIYKFSKGKVLKQWLDLLEVVK